MTKEITIRINETGEVIKANEPKNIWVFPISKKANHYGLAFSDVNWHKKTILVSSDSVSLEQKAQQIRVAFSRNATSVAV